jgi:preprotein translocase subunit SecY
MVLGLARIGTHVITPGINTAALQEMWATAQNTLFGLYDLFAGGAFSRAAVFGLGIMPYISASIIFQLLGAVWPTIQRLQQSGEEGRKKITQYTRYFTLILSAMQAFGVAIWLESQPALASGEVVLIKGWGFKLLTMISMSSGTMLLMWMGEQIDERGIGNGISLLIMVGIIAGLPSALSQEWYEFMQDNRTLLTELFLIALAFLIIAFVVILTQAQRKIPVQYAKRVVGRKVYGGVNTHFPLRVNTAGVMPIIFAQAIMFVPNTFFSLFPDSDFIASISRLFAWDHWFYWLIYGLIIIFFTYFYTAIVLNPVEVADNLKKQGGFIPGVRPGKKTAEYLDSILTRVTLPGAIALALVAIIPGILVKFFNIGFGYASFFGGTGLLIIVGVALDFIQQVESHLYMRHYEGFSKGGRIRGRR